jgi:hypothetical protein
MSFRPRRGICQGASAWRPRPGLGSSSVERQGHFWATVRRAKKALGVVAFREGGTADKGQWLWRLPDPESPKMLIKSLRGSRNNVSALGEIEHLSGGDGPNGVAADLAVGERIPS